MSRARAMPQPTQQVSVLEVDEVNETADAAAGSVVAADDVSELDDDASDCRAHNKRKHARLRQRYAQKQPATRTVIDVEVVPVVLVVAVVLVGADRSPDAESNCAAPSCAIFRKHAERQFFFFALKIIDSTIDSPNEDRRAQSRAAS